MRSAVVVLVSERVEEDLQLGQGGGLLWLGSQPLLQGLLEPFDAPMFVKPRLVARRLLACWVVR